MSTARTSGHDRDDLRSLLAGAVLDVAPRLLGARLTHAGVTCRITEVEAYAGADDPASHAFRGPTPRTEVMFGPAGRLYVYRSYGLHWACNVVTGPDGLAAAVLLRAGSVVEGADLAARRRGLPESSTALARGPGNFTVALGIDGSDNGTDLFAGSPVLAAGEAVAPDRVRHGPRVGVSRAAASAWRFWLVDEPSVSAYRRSPRAPAPSMSDQPEG